MQRFARKLMSSVSDWEQSRSCENSTIRNVALWGSSHTLQVLPTLQFHV